jgi:hypothetical protein
VIERLPDGSFLSEVYAFDDRRRREHGMPVRVIEYELDDPGRPANDTRYRLLSAVLDPYGASAAELAPLYTQRWEFESALDELKVHQRGPRVVLRSKTPDSVIQEAYGHLCVHYAIRWLMHDIAIDAGHDPRPPVVHPYPARRAPERPPRTRAVPPSALSSALEQAADELLFELLPPRRLRANPRVVKRKMSNYAVKRAAHRNPPKPTGRPDDITILAA